MVGERTRRAVSGFHFGDEQLITVKGKGEPVRGAVLLERTERRAPKAPFVGRESDLAQLELVARRAFTERRPQLVTVTAPAGTGKSRLVDEFIARLGRTDLTVATAQCLPYGAAVTFLPLRGLIRGLLRIGRDADILEPLREAFGNASYADADVRRLSSLVSMTLGDAGDTERADREEIFTAWRLLIEALARGRPLLVVFEDLHWASDTLIDLVEYVTASRTSAPLVMVALARPELIDRRPTWGGGRRNFTSLALEPLTTEETLRLVEVLTEGVPEEIAGRIVERAGGNPFFAGELVRAYEDRRSAGQVDEDIRLPDTVHATVLARMDGLPVTQRSALEFAAVAGRTAHVAALTALLPDLGGERGVSDALDALAERDLLVAQGAGAYTFRHIVIREVAYVTLPRADRVRAHLRLARWFETDAPSHGAEFAELVAYHYRQAIALSPRGRLPEGLDVSAVVAALERAAEVASAGAGYDEAGKHVEEAIRLAAPAEHQRLYERMGDLIQFGDRTIDAYAESFVRWQAAGGADPAVGARLLVKRLDVLGRWAGSINRTPSAEEVAELANTARALVEQTADEVLRARLTVANAFAGARGERLDEATYHEMVARLESARRVLAAQNDPNTESLALDAIGALHRDAGDSETALATQQERMRMADRLGLLERIDAWSGAVWDNVNLCRFGEAIRMFNDARQALRPGEPEYMLAHGIAWAAYAAMLCGQWDKALELGDELLETREQSPQTVGRFTFPGWVGALRVASARLDTSRLARYRAAFGALAQLPLLQPHVRPLWQAFIDGDTTDATTFLLHPLGPRDRKGELVALILFEGTGHLGEDVISAVEQQTISDPPLVRLRLSLARALNSDDAAVRRAIAELDGRDLVADAARATTLLALRTRDLADRADAEVRLTSLGDRVYLQKLSEEW
jgi:tetratricopeptide (TPR) repeat protein